jgi:large subunit ribosomal protein L22
MPQATAQLKHLKVSAKKIRPLASALRGKNIEQADWIIKNSRSGSASNFWHTLTNAKAMLEAKNGSATKAIIAEIRVDEGSRLKRFRPVARGRSAAYQHGQSHLSITLSDEIKVKTKKKDVKDQNGPKS